MDQYIVDDKIGITSSFYIESSGNFIQCSNPMFRLVYVMEGSGIIKINGQATIFPAPALFCFSDMDEVEIQQSINIKAQAAYFKPTVINNVLQPDIIRKEGSGLSDTEYQDYFLLVPFIYREDFRIPYIEMGPITSKRIAMLFKGMREELTCMGDFWECRSRSYLLEILFLIQKIITDSRNKESISLPETEKDISDIILYLHTNYDKKVTIEELTDIFHINRTTLSKKFRKSMGLSIIDYLVKYRIKMASVMLRETALPIAEILNRVGFNDSVYFSRMFKKHMGYTPSSYRGKYTY